MIPQRVLIVEDNDMNIKLFRDLLQAHGYEAFTTKEGLEVIPLARDRKPDLILMDIQLPEISGLEVIKWLKDDPVLKTIPIIAITAFAMPNDEAIILASGCAGYLSKPISIERFIGMIKRVLPPPLPLSPA